ncbi:serine hydroxymethyltransferase [Cobetia sp. 4B]|uniref:serine hydroxymethyltransferase n=1 Tax=Cobetia sp. 4B TaxID=2758724 RepID=UPI001C03EFF1|nr:serine hydroxymethyltransferase [Cobetia sp. 4B]MBR9754792.1 serine hydroxymethyltransferase [Gammaproteobacteria bacterium]QWN37352.1 serine hydroxymethyltransferase [Cobetia sp. 4B]
MSQQHGYTRDDRLARLDPALAEAILEETARQEAHIELIASENYASPLVMEAQGSQLTNKYAEGYPGKRYYGGCEFVDKVETLAIERACALFGCDYANVQPHSGAQANAAVFMALVSPGDTILGMSLAHGGHLTHGAAPNFSGKHYNAIQYGLTESGELDYEEMERLAREHKPKMIIAGFSAYSRVVNWRRFRDIADEIGAWLMVDMAHVAGLVAAGHYPSPLPYAHVVTTTTHKTLRGPRGGLILSATGDEALHKKLNGAVFPGQQGGPLMHVIAAKAAAFKEAMSQDFVSYQARVIANARVMAEVFMARGYDVVSGGTDDHLFLVSLIRQGVTGKDADASLGRAHITVNKNSVPNDPQSPFVTSGLRIGTPAATTRGFGEAECEALAGWICDLLDALATGESAKVEAEVRGKVEEVCARFPVYASDSVTDPAALA